jgi:sulfonate transport system ATP-binding protein
MTIPFQQPAVRLRGVGRVFGKRRILSDIDLTIHQGEFVVLVGKSGCGKSTLLKIVGGLDSGSEGDAAVASNHAIVFQDPRLLPWKPVWKNVILGVKGSPPSLRAQAGAALAEVGLTERADAWPLTLSGGEAQRVAIARALVRAPDLLLMDEPFAALDALTRLKMQQQVAGLWRRRRIATLFVTHDVDEALLLADRIILIEAGRIARQFDIGLPRPRHREHPRFVALRKELLADLGVESEDVAEFPTLDEQPTLSAARIV